MKKTKLNMRAKILGAVAMAAAFFIGAVPITAFAGGAECTCEHKCTEDCIDPDCELCKIDYTLCYADDTEPEEPAEPDEENWGPLTPDGNMTLVDDYGSLEAGGKQFITVVTKSGNYFYIIIDRDDQGEETVHFLNMVDESDLLALMDDDQVKEYISSKGLAEEEPAPVVEEPKEEPKEPEEEPEEPKPEKKNPAGTMALLLLIGIGGVGGYIYFTKVKGKKTTTTFEDPDADYNEDEDYLDNLPDDIEETAFVDEPDDKEPDTGEDE